jgi:hypothetical protein
MLSAAVDVALDRDFQIVDDGRTIEGCFDRGEGGGKRGALGSALRRVVCGACRAQGAFKIALGARPMDGAGRVGWAHNRSVAFRDEAHGLRAFAREGT